MGSLVDPQERRVSYLRVSLTDRCNYRCTYCMPEDGVATSPREELLSFEELERVVGVFVGLGVRRVRLTGGEPTIRRDVVEIVRRLAGLVPEVVMTTNGHLLAELAQPLADAGLAGLNVSVDSLDAARFHEITRRGDLARVLAGIEAARAASLPTKLNAVALAGFNEDELGALCTWSWARGVTPRFIEWMPLSDGALYAPGRLLEAPRIRELLQTQLGVTLTPAAAHDGAVGPARYLRADLDPAREVGIISAMSEHFCATCNRVRLTAQGTLHTCLGHDDATDLRGPLRAGADDATLAGAIRAAVGMKRDGHQFQRTGAGAPRKHMVVIGG